jgi:hypothetical protein
VEDWLEDLGYEVDRKMRAFRDVRGEVAMGGDSDGASVEDS